MKLQKGDIAKVRHLELVSRSQSSRTQKGAMFGLDARIALAIFGALSVISGAAFIQLFKKQKLQQF